MWCKLLCIWHQQNLYFTSVTKPGSLTQCAASQRAETLRFAAKSLFTAAKRGDGRTDPKPTSQARAWDNYGMELWCVWSPGKVSGNKEKVWSSSFCADITKLQASSWPVCPELVVLPCFEVELLALWRQRSQRGHGTYLRSVVLASLNAQTGHSWLKVSEKTTGANILLFMFKW